MFGDVWTVANDMVGDFRIPFGERIRICTAHDTVHPLMDDGGEVFQRRCRLLLTYGGHAFGCLGSRILKSG